MILEKFLSEEDGILVLIIGSGVTFLPQLGLPEQITA
jgi:hypothetical protein